MMGAEVQSGSDTLLLVDVDGVLNIGVKDEATESTLSFSRQNLERCERLQGSDVSAQQQVVIDSFFEVADRQHPLESCSCRKILESSQLQIDVLETYVDRLAQLIRAAGHRRCVVLTSTWRKPEHSRKLCTLEKAISEKLGEPFVFDAKTSLEEAPDAAGRLRGIRRFIKDACAHTMATSLRVLVLEDFHVTPLNSWKCGKRTISSTEDAEAYLLNAIPSHLQATVRLLHTYDEWHTGSGLHVQIGSGLTMKHFKAAMQLLSDFPPQYPRVCYVDVPSGFSPSLPYWSSVDKAVTAYEQWQLWAGGAYEGGAYEDAWPVAAQQGYYPVSPSAERRFCPQCGSPCAPGAAFCGVCGLQLP